MNFNVNFLIAIQKAIVTTFFVALVAMEVAGVFGWYPHPPFGVYALESITLAELLEGLTVFGLLSAVHVAIFVVSVSLCAVERCTKKKIAVLPELLRLFSMGATIMFVHIFVKEHFEEYNSKTHIIHVVFLVVHLIADLFFARVLRKMSGPGGRIVDATSEFATFFAVPRNTTDEREQEEISLWGDVELAPMATKADSRPPTPPPTTPPQSQMRFLSDSEEELITQSLRRPVEGVSSFTQHGQNFSTM